MSLAPNKVELFRLKLQQGKTLSSEEKAVLSAGFNSNFWVLLKKQLEETLDSTRVELETTGDLSRVGLLQGEIAALRVLLDLAAVTKMMPPSF